VQWQSLTEHDHVAAEDLSVWAVTAHHMAQLWRFVILAQFINVMTYLLI